MRSSWSWLPRLSYSSSKVLWQRSPQAHANWSRPPWANLLPCNAWLPQQRLSARHARPLCWNGRQQLQSSS
ncbi:hypothetical protein V5799_005090 [Amblyomma americanum]|uniref:Uncharacterized protein n=1 Tax=Amblyomma americanum TaxID=6943 RepID=A0AAQ4E089_AMBAM